MRDLINIANRLFEKKPLQINQPEVQDIGTPVPSDDHLQSLKKAISHKIDNLPTDLQTARALEEIEDILSSIELGGRSQQVGVALDDIDDKDVKDAKKLLAMYVLSLPITPGERGILFKHWKENKLIDVDKLRAPGRHNIGDIIPEYNNTKSNPGVKHLVDDLARVSGLGVGKGEFLLCVLSKRITKASKGDLLIDGKELLEVKTRDAGAARLTDREVTVTGEYGGLSSAFFAKYRNLITTWLGERVAAGKGTGINLQQLMEMGHKIEMPKERDEYWELIERILENIFPGCDIDDIMDGVKVGNINLAKKAYAEANLEYYLKAKQEQGMLFIDLVPKIPTFTFFKTIEELKLAGLRLHADTTYPVTLSTPGQAVYPKITIKDMKAGPAEPTGTADVAGSKETGTPGIPPEIRPLDSKRTKRDRPAGIGRQER
jgi:hypothetical protein